MTVDEPTTFVMSDDIDTSDVSIFEMQAFLSSIRAIQAEIEEILAS
jgi:hypothetical protein